MKYSEYRLVGEWFQLTPELQIEIGAIRSVYPLESYLNTSEEDRVAYDDALAEWSSAINKLNEEYDSKIEKLQEEIERLESLRDAEEEKLDRVFEERTKCIYPWWQEKK